MVAGRKVKSSEVIGLSIYVLKKWNSPLLENFMNYVLLGYNFYASQSTGPVPFASDESVLDALHAINQSEGWF